MKLAHGISNNTFWLAVTRLLAQQCSYALVYEGKGMQNMVPYVERLRKAWLENMASRREAKTIGSMLASRPKDNPLTGAGQQLLERCNELQVIYRAAYRKVLGEYRFNSIILQLMQTDWCLQNQFVCDFIKRSPDRKWTVERRPPAWTVAPRGTWKTIPKFGRMNFSIYLNWLLESRAVNRFRYTFGGQDIAKLEAKFDELVDADAGVDTLKWFDENNERRTRALVHYGNTRGGYPLLGIMDCRFDRNGVILNAPYDSERNCEARVLMFK